MNSGSFIARIGILSVSIAGTFGVYYIVDSEYLTRRIHDYYPAYLTIYFFTLFVSFAIHLRSPYALVDKLWKCLGYGIAHGCFAGVIGYFFGIEVDIANLSENKNLFLVHFAQNPFEYLMVILSYPTFVLKSWLYGGLVSLSIFVFIKRFRGRSASHHRRLG